VKPVIAKKRLGQNFLRDRGVIARIVASLDLSPADVVFEIGCGTGALTRSLIGKTREFVGVELDPALFDMLNQEFSGNTVHLLNQSVLDLDLGELQKRLGLGTTRLKVVGNLPYYISSPTLQWLGRQAEFLQSATVMLQWEMASRLLSVPGSKEYGVLTVMMQH
jgi:16S rRNA (adenine1518-N6/adenine1519-N6)-dimethyltransferase